MSARLLGRTGATAGTDFKLMGVATIGASSENEIRIAAPGVSRRHARIVVENDQYFVEDAGATNGTFLNGGRIQRETLRHLDVITLGRDVDLIFIRREGDTAPPTVDRVTNARLQIADGPEAGTVVEIPKGELTLGRAPSCNVVLASGLISKVHARIQRTSNQVVLQDLQSINGTFVNGARVDSVVVLKDGDVISFAGVRSVSVSIEGSGGATAKAAAAGPPAPIAEPAFNQEWKTRFVWAPDELALIEAARAEAMQLAAVRAPGAAGGAADKKPAAAAAKPAAAPAKPAAAVSPKQAEPAKADASPPAAKADVAAPPVAPKPAPPAAPKVEGAQPKPNVVPPKVDGPKPPAPADVAKVVPSADVKPAGPAQAAVQQAAAAPIKPGTPVPIKPEPAAPISPKPAAAPAKPVAPPPAPKPEEEGAPTMMIMPAAPAAQDGDVTMAASKAPRLRGIRLVGPGLPISLGLGSSASLRSSF